MHRRMHNSPIAAVDICSALISKSLDSRCDAPVSDKLICIGRYYA